MPFESWGPPCILNATRPGYRPHAYSMNQPWLTMSDWPVSAFELKPAKNSAASATSSTVVNSPSTVSFNPSCNQSTLSLTGCLVRLLCARDERPSCRAAEQRNDLAPFQVIELHPLAPSHVGA